MDVLGSKKRIVTLLRTGSKNFNELLDGMLGIYPSALSHLLSVLIEEGSIKKKSGQFFLNIEYEDSNSSTGASGRFGQKFENILSDLHNPHFLDYEWWFTPSTTESIFYRIKESAIAKSPKMCFLGAPLLGAFCHCIEPESEICIVDRSAPTLEIIEKHALTGGKLKLVHHDLQYPLPEELLDSFDLVFLDPPWYIDYYKLFLSRAVEVLSSGYIYVVLFPLLTRPNAPQERHKIFELISRMGLIPIELSRESVVYLTPLFEKISLSHQDIVVSDNWRKADLLSLISSDETEPLVSGICKIEVSDWREIVIGKSKIKVRITGSEEYAVPHIEPLYKESPILKSVSRRDPKRQEIDMWTSKHQVFKLEGNKVVFFILKGISENLGLDVIIKNISKSFRLESKEIREEISLCYSKLKEVIDYEVG